MVKVLLWIGVVLGGLLALFGLLAFVSVPDQPADQQGDTVAGAIMFLVVGLVIGVPSLVFLIRAGRRAWQPHSELEALYRQWFSWAETLGADAITANSAACTALATRATPSEAETVARHAAALMATERGPAYAAASINKGKLNVLAAVAAMAVPVLEPGERVIATFRGVDRQATMGAALFGLIGQLIAMSQECAYYLVLTDRRMIALQSRQYAPRPGRVSWAIPGNGIACSLGWALFGSRRVKLRWPGGGLTLGVTRRWSAEADLAAAQSAPVAATAPVFSR